MARVFKGFVLNNYEVLWLSVDCGQIPRRILQEFQLTELCEPSWRKRKSEARIDLGRTKMVLLSHLEHFWLSLAISVRSCSLLAQNAAKQICLAFWTILSRFAPFCTVFHRFSPFSPENPIIPKKFTKIEKSPKKVPKSQKNPLHLFPHHLLKIAPSHRNVW